MIFSDYPVRPRTQAEIDAIALSWRLGKQTVSLPIDVLRIATYAKVSLVFRSDKEMGEELAYASSTANRVFLRESLRAALEMKQPEARLRLCHEFGHIALHRTPELKALKAGGNEPLQFISTEESAEDQAWKFARALLIPPAAVLKYRDAEVIAQSCLVTEEQAHLRLVEVNNNISPQRKTDLLADLQEKRVSAQRTSAEAELEDYRQRITIWNSLQIVPDKHPSAFRKCECGYLIAWNEYGKMTECGWLVHSGRAYWWRALLVR